MTAVNLVSMSDETPTMGEETPATTSRKLEQKRARREQDERRKKEQASAARRRVLTTSMIAVVVGLLVVALVMREKSARERATIFGPAAAAAGCEEVETFDEIKGDHIGTGEDPGPEAYNSIPPTSGPMWEPLAPTGFLEQALALPEPLHNLEHGTVIVYYDDGLDDSDLGGLRAYAERAGSAVIAAPAPDGVDAPVTLTAWRKLQSCDEVSSAAIDEFRRSFQGKAPEGAAVGPFDG